MNIVLPERTSRFSATSSSHAIKKKVNPLINLLLSWKNWVKDASLASYPRANDAKHRSGRKPGARVTNSARLFTPGKMRTQRSVAKCKALCKVHQWLRAHHFGSSVDLTDLKYMADRQEWKGQRSKKIYERTITQHEEKFFQPSLKGMIRFDLNMEHDEVHGKFVLTVCICSICIFAKKFPIAKRLCFSFHKRYD